MTKLTKMGEGVWLTVEVLWAKKREGNGQWLWLPLMQHLEDTRSVAHQLWHHWVSDGVREFIEQSLEMETVDFLCGEKLVCFLAAVHDIGKATPVFQTKKGFANSTDLDAFLLDRLEAAGFTGIRNHDWASASSSPHALAGEWLLSSYGISEDITSIIGAHHGKPTDQQSIVKDQKGYKTNYFQSEKEERAIYQKWHHVQREIFNWALQRAGFASINELPKVSQPAQVLLSGLLMMADWIASNEEYFPLIPVQQTSINDSRRRFEEGYSKWRQTESWQPEYSLDLETLYQCRFGIGQPYELQNAVVSLIAQAESPGMMIIEAPMGEGKTESALAAAELLAAKTGRNGIFFGLPTQATSNGMFSRVEKWIQKLNHDGLVSMQLVHGKAALNDSFSSLPRANSINIDEEHSSLVMNDWFLGPKKSMLDDFVVGTIDHLLMMALKKKHLALRHLGFNKKVVIIDEVHAYDAYMNQYLLKAIEWLGSYHTPVILLSATLPSNRRSEIIWHYLKGMGVSGGSYRKQLVQDLDTTAYPLVTYTDGTEAYQYHTIESNKHKEIYVIQLSEEALVKTILSSIEEGGVVGVVVNTVKRAQMIGRELVTLLGEDKVDILHSGFIATDRICKEKHLLQQIGREGHRPYQKVIVGTQVIEQSLDIDFDVMISDLAPMDLLIQRMGRLHRHERPRLNRHRDALFYVLGCSEALTFEEGASYVYGDYWLERTQYYLPSVLHIPQDISPLVQAVYCSNEPIEYESKELQQKYDKDNESTNQQIHEKATKAKSFQIDSPRLKKSDYKPNTLIGWLNNTSPNDSEEKAYAQVRDIQETIEVIALKQIGTGYGVMSSHQDISQQILEHSIGKKVAQQTIRLPNILSNDHRIDKTIQELESYNNIHLSNWRQSIWLKERLGIIFDEENRFYLDDYVLIYEEKYGIKIERQGVEKNESV